jgi:hypothetical protein
MKTEPNKTMARRRITIVAGVVVLLGVAMLTGRTEHYSVRHEDTLSVKRYARLRVLGIPVFRSTVSEQAGFIKEYKDLFGSEPDPKYLKAYPPDFIKGIGFRAYRSFGVRFESKQRREIVRRIYDLYRAGRSKAETKQSLGVVDSLLPPDSLSSELNFEGIDALRTSIGLTPIMSPELKTTEPTPPQSPDAPRAAHSAPAQIASDQSVSSE